MGQSSPSSMFQQSSWQPLSSPTPTPWKTILFNPKQKKTVEKHEIIVDSEEKQINQICQWRSQLSNTSNNVIELYQYGIKKYTLCNGLPILYVVVQRLVLLKDIGGFSMAEGIIMLRQAATGLKVLFEKFGYFNINSSLIGVNSQGIAKVWIAQNMAQYYGFRTPQSGTIELEIINNLVRLLQLKTLPTSRYSFPIQYPKNLDIDSLLAYLNSILQQLPTQYKIDKIYLDRSEFEKKYNENQNRAQQKELFKTNARDNQRKLGDISRLEVQMEKAQVEIVDQEYYAKLMQIQMQEQAIRQQVQAIRIQEQQYKKKHQLILANQQELQRQQQFQSHLQQQLQLQRQQQQTQQTQRLLQAQIQRQAEIQIELQRKQKQIQKEQAYMYSQRQVEMQRLQQIQIQKKQQMEIQRQVEFARKNQQPVYYAQPSISDAQHHIHVPNQQPQQHIQIQKQQQKLHGQQVGGQQLYIQQQSQADNSKGKITKATISTVQSQQPRKIQQISSHNPPQNPHQVRINPQLQTILQNMPQVPARQIARKNSFESYRSYNSNGSKIKKQIEMVDSMILMQEDEMSDQQNNRIIQSRIIQQYPL